MRILHQKLCLLLFLLIGSSLSILAQNKTISGLVKDASDFGAPGASVLIKGSTIGTITDIDGNYTLSVPVDAKQLVFSFVGYDSQTITIGNKTTINVVLKESSLMLDEVVAIGYAKVRRKDLTGASVSVAGGDLKIVPVTTAAQALTGKAAGVNVITQSGAPGADINITVRGGGSITQSTSPLYIVDGFQMENGLQNVDINDIETIDVLKDASSTAIYGAQGSNGVI
ncbi:MAG: carboxypeptidase-like regulatory domain-containing protein, partial [Bacteroidaceae bacterium]